LQTEEADDALGASAINRTELASVRREVTDLPPGPDTDASTASPHCRAEGRGQGNRAAAGQPTEPEEADRVVTETESKKPKEDDPKVAAVQTQASTESVASEATATPGSDAIPKGSDRWRRRSVPGRPRDACARRQKELIAHLDKHKRYPADRSQNPPRSRSFHPRPGGSRALDQHRKGSGDTAFDEAALAMVRRPTRCRRRRR
jgi:hypothetical protein